MSVRRWAASARCSTLKSTISICAWAKDSHWTPRFLNENGQSTPITISVPDNRSATLIVDPQNQVLYLDGHFNLSQVLRLAVVGSMMGIDVGQLPMLGGLALPLRSTVGMAALFSWPI